MPRPKTKAELLSASVDGYAQLNAMLAALTPSQQNSVFPFEHRDRNLRDVMAHLHEWQVMMLNWYESGIAGDKPDMPAKGYTWKTTPELNAAIWARYQGTSLTLVRRKLATTHDALLDIITARTNDELFTKCRYSWTGTTSLGSYLTSALPSHYDWAMKIVRRYSRTFRSCSDIQ